MNALPSEVLGVPRSAVALLRQTMRRDAVPMPDEVAESLEAPHLRVLAAAERRFEEATKFWRRSSKQARRESFAALSGMVSAFVMTGAGAGLGSYGYANLAAFPDVGMKIVWMGGALAACSTAMAVQTAVVSRGPRAQARQSRRAARQARDLAKDAHQEFAALLDRGPERAAERSQARFERAIPNLRDAANAFGAAHGSVVKHGHPLFSYLGVRPDSPGAHQDVWDETFLYCVLQVERNGLLNSTWCTTKLEAARADLGQPDQSFTDLKDTQLQAWLDGPSR